jgi:hypothetical protein
MPLRVETLFNDPTSDGYINQRYVIHMMRIALDSTDLTDEEYRHFVEELLLIAKKLVAVWTHYQKYLQLEQSIVAIENEKPPLQDLDLQHLSYSQDLFLEFDEFLVQIKSTLDYLAKLPQAIIGKNNFPYLRTFGQKGKDVINALNNNIPQRWERQAGMLRDYIIKEHQPWIEVAVQSRDRTNHNKDGGVDYKTFLIAKTRVDGVQKVVVPFFQDGFTVSEYMKPTWFNLFRFAEEFTGGFLLMRLKPGLGYLHTFQPPESIVSPIVVASEAETLEIFERERLMQIERNKNRSQPH